MAMKAYINNEYLNYGNEVKASDIITSVGKTSDLPVTVDTAYHLLLDISEEQISGVNHAEVISKLSSELTYKEFVLPFLGVLTDTESYLFEVNDTKEVDDDHSGFFLCIDEANDNDVSILVTVDIDKLSLESKVLHYSKESYTELVDMMLSSDINKKELEHIRHTNKQRSNDEILKYTINEDDNNLVVLLKEYINSIELHPSTVYSCFESDGDGWNLIYGLRNRSSITWDYFTRWATILNCDIDLELVPKD